MIENITRSEKADEAGLNATENLILSDNSILKFPPWFCTSDSKSLYPNLHSLALTSNFITFPVKHAWSCLKKLRILSLRKNVLQTIQDDVFSDLESLEVLDVSNMLRSITKIGVQAFNISQLKVLHFEKNHMKFKAHSDIPFEKLFVHLHNLQTIHLESNDFRMSHARMKRMLAPLKNLEHLHLGDINLAEIPRGLLGHFRNLTMLNLSKNKISKIDTKAFANVTSLEYIFLYGNRIKSINDKSFPGAVKKSLKQINLGDNPFSCKASTCNNMWFRNWIEHLLAKNVTVLGWPGNYTCHYPTRMRGKSLQKYHPTPGDCKAKNPLITVCISLAIFLVIALTFGAAVYRGRWYIKYWIYKLRRRHKLSYDKNPEAQGLLQDQTTCIYDAYVIYHYNDLAFVQQTLLPFMEQEHGYELPVFITDRQGEIGAKPVDIMADNVYRSNHVIALVSRHFLNDQWCEFQLNVTLDRPRSFHVLKTSLDRQVELKRNCLLL